MKRSALKQSIWWWLSFMQNRLGDGDAITEEEDNKY